MTAYAYQRPYASAPNVIAVMGLAVGLGWWMAAVRPGMNELLLGGIALTLGLPILHRWATGTFDILEPLTIFVAMYGLLFFVRPVATLASGDFMVQGYNINGVFPELLTVSSGPSHLWSDTFSRMAITSAAGFLHWPLTFALSRRFATQ